MNVFIVVLISHAREFNATEVFFTKQKNSQTPKKLRPRTKHELGKIKQDQPKDRQAETNKHHPSKESTKCRAPSYAGAAVLAPLGALGSAGPLGTWRVESDSGTALYNSQTSVRLQKPPAHPALPADPCPVVALCPHFGGIF